MSNLQRQSLFYGDRWFSNSTGFTSETNYPIYNNRKLEGQVQENDEAIDELIDAVEDLDVRVTALENAEQSGNISLVVENVSITVEMDASFNVLILRNTSGAPITITLDDTNTADLAEYKIVTITSGPPNTIVLNVDFRAPSQILASEITFDLYSSNTIIYIEDDSLFYLLNTTGGDIL